MKVYELLGTPLSLHRPRFSKGNVYDDQKSLKLYHMVLIKSQHGRLPLFDKPTHIDITFTFPVPASYSLKRKNALSGTCYPGRPDLDNLIKMVLDVCINACYKDDAIITSITARKVYGPEGKTTFFFSSL